MNRVFVLDSLKNPLMPCCSARARELLSAGRAAVFRTIPFTIVLKDRVGGEIQPIEFKVDPGSKTTGMALVGAFKRGLTLIWAANLTHRGEAIKRNLLSRRSLRRGRRARKTRYRQPRFLNRTRPQGWLPPSLMSRVNNVSSWLRKLISRAPISECHIETVRFDMTKMQNPEVSGAEYQQGTLAGYEVRNYLLEKWRRKCAYCGNEGIPLEIEHIQARSQGGSDRVSNLTLACRPCNLAKGAKSVEDFVKDPKVLEKLLAQAKAPLKDAAAVNATRYAIGDVVKAFGLPTEFWSGGRTKFNRCNQGYPKDHFIDASCVGASGEKVWVPKGFQALGIKATGRGTHQTVRTDKYGFPRGKAGRVKRVHGFQTGDLVRLVKPKGKYAGVHVGRLASIRVSGTFDIQTERKVPNKVGNLKPLKISASYKNFNLIQRGDGFAFTLRAKNAGRDYKPFGPSASQTGSGGQHPSLDAFEVQQWQ